MGPDRTDNGTFFDWGCAHSDFRGEDWIQFLYEEPSAEELSVMRATRFKAQRHQAQTISLVVAASEYYSLYFGNHEWVGQLMKRMSDGGIPPRQAQLRALYTVALLRQGARDWSLGLAATLKQTDIDTEEIEFPSSGLHLFAVGEVARILAEVYLPKTKELGSYLPIEPRELHLAAREVAGLFQPMGDYFSGECHPMHNVFSGMQAGQILELLQAAPPRRPR